MRNAALQHCMMLTRLNNLIPLACILVLVGTFWLQYRREVGERTTGKAAGLAKTTHKRQIPKIPPITKTKVLRLKPR